MVWRVNGETATILGGGRALLMQLAEPMVAAGVADHSRFEDDAFTRLWRTLEAVLTVAFGDSEQALAAAARVNQIHASVTGVRDDRPYRATDPELLLWVHATLLDSALVAYRRFVGPLSLADAERYHGEMRRFGALFGVPEGLMPNRLDAFGRYLGARLAEVRVTPEARRLAEEILRPPVTAALVPARGLWREVTVDLLPAALRAGFGLPSGPARRRAVGALAAGVRRTLPHLPANIRRWPHAEAARGRVGG
jgi:uncharacterized protein (DUF2236 family)